MMKGQVLLPWMLLGVLTHMGFLMEISVRQQMLNCVVIPLWISEVQ